MTFRHLLVALGLLGLVACSDGETQPLADLVVIEDRAIAGLDVSASKTIIGVSEVLALTAVDTASGADVASALGWSSSNDGVATVDGDGNVTGLADGVAMITGSIGALSDTVAITVSSAALLSIEVTSTEVPIDVCRSGQFAATGTYADGRVDDVTSQVTWTSADTSSAVFDANTAGLLNTLLSGTVNVSASLDGVTSTSFAAVISNSLTGVSATLADSSIDTAATTTVTATGDYSGTSSDISTTASYSSGTTSVATVDSAGTVTGVSAGTSIITATCNALAGDATLTVTDGTSTATLVDLDIEGTAPFTVLVGDSLQLTAIAEFSDLSTQDVTEDATWTIALGSSNAASVSNVAGSRGLVTTNFVGTSIVRAEFETEDVTVEVRVDP